MSRSIAVIGLSILLAACQTNQVPRDFDTNRDFTAYLDWAWAEPAVSYTPANDPRIQSDLTTQRIREAVSGQLDARGLRPAATVEEADLKVRVHMVIEEEQDNVTTHYGGGFGYGWGMWGGGPIMAQTRSVSYQVATLQIDLLDASDGQLVWRGSTSEVLRDRTPAERSQNTHQMVQTVLSEYPPY